MPCFVPFDQSFDISFFALQPAGASTDELIAQLKFFSFHAEDLGCAYSSIFRSIHGSLVIWYGAWIKRSFENQQILYNTLVSALKRVSDLGILVNHGFYEPYAGESKDGRAAARFCSGDAVFMGAIIPISGDVSDLSYAFLALQKSCFMKMEGASAAVCLRGRSQPIVTCFLVWKSLEECYAWLLTSDYSSTIRPFISHLAEETHFDVFKVVYVSNEDVPNIRLVPSWAIGSGDRKRDEE